MFGCLRRIGCIALIIVALAAAWYWYTQRRPREEPVVTRTRSTWENVTPIGAERGAMALQALSRPGTQFVTLTAADVAASIFFSKGASRLPESTHSLQAAVLGDQLAVRGVVPLRDLGVGRLLGPLASFVSESDTIFFSGRLSVVQPEVGQYRVTELRLQQFRVPSGIVPRVLRGIDKNDRPPGVAPDALALPLPPYISDIRTAGGVVTLYRGTR